MSSSLVIVLSRQTPRLRRLTGVDRLLLRRGIVGELPHQHKTMADRLWENRARLTQFRVDVSGSGGSARVSIPSLGFDSLNRRGKLSFWHTQQLMTAARIFAYHHRSPSSGKSFLEYDVLTSDRFMFMGSTHTQISPGFHGLLTANKPAPQLAVDIKLGYLGSASISSVAQLVDTNDDSVLLTNTNSVVSVDKTTRKVTPLPDWWRDKYTSCVADDKKVQVAKIEKGANTYQYKLKVPWSDIDGYRHTTYTAYIRYCDNAAMDAIQHGHLAGFHDDIYDYEIRQVSLLFQKESRAGEELTASVWQSEEDPYTLHFHIDRGNERLIENTIQYYPPLT